MAIKIVKTESGLIKGQPAYDQAVSVFKGIPYAAPPTGENRWRLPQPCQAWEGVRECFDFGPMCVQKRLKPDEFYAREFYPDLEMPQSEDCLFLNVWTPAKTGDEKLPVAIWIHGGGFEFGYSHKMELDGCAFARRGVIYVSINYRLNVFGFFAHPDLSRESGYNGSGNYGNYDQLAAIKWVRNNIEAFGGDPEKITIFGQSAGAASIETLCVSPLSKGLFQRAIMQSCGGLDEGMWGSKPLEAAEKRGADSFEFAGFKSLEEARAVPAEELFRKIKEFAGTSLGGVCVRNVDNYLLPQTERDQLLEGNFMDIDYMVGGTKDEFMSYPPKEVDLEEYHNYVKALFKDEADAFEKQFPVTNGEEAAEISSRLWGCGILAFDSNFCRLMARKGTKPAYQYWFTRMPPGDDGMGVFHSSEYMMEFRTQNLSWRAYTGADYEFSDQMNRYFANFMICGDPNGVDMHGKPMTEWTPYTIEKPYAMELGETCRMVDPGYPFGKFYVKYLEKKNNL